MSYVEPSRAFTQTYPTSRLFRRFGLVVKEMVASLALIFAGEDNVREHVLNQTADGRRQAACRVYRSPR